MMHVVHKRSVVVAFIVVAVLALGHLISTQIISAQAASQNDTMRELLETLNSRIENEESFQVVFRFVHPLMDNDELFWDIPYAPPDEDISRWIGEIGDDFVCFYEMAGSAGVARCTPFSNIVSVSYLGSP